MADLNQSTKQLCYLQNFSFLLNIDIYQLLAKLETNQLSSG